MVYWRKTWSAFRVRKIKKQGNYFYYTMSPFFFMFFSFIPLLSSIGSCLHLCFFWVKTKQRRTATTEHTMHTIIRYFTNTPKHVRNTKKKKYERKRRIPTFHITLLFYPRTWRFILNSDLLGKWHLHVLANRRSYHSIRHEQFLVLRYTVALLWRIPNLYYLLT